MSPNVVVERPRAPANKALRGLAATQPTLGAGAMTRGVCTLIYFPEEGRPVMMVTLQVGN